MFFRERDGVAIAGDVISNLNPLTRRARLAEPPWMYSDDPQENRRSIRKLLELRPRVICFGHGPPLRDIAQLEALVERIGA
jgi:glyoxylase-like metal-dependent hydrolase (beta-lactamase superfamily II)